MCFHNCSGVQAGQYRLCYNGGGSLYYIEFGHLLTITPFSPAKVGFDGITVGEKSYLEISMQARVVGLVCGYTNFAQIFTNIVQL